MKYIEQIGYRSEARVRAKLENLIYYPFHIHEDSLEIICVLNGSVKICDAAATYTLSYGDVHFFNCRDPHKITSDDPESIILTVHIDLDHYGYHFSDLRDTYFICDSYQENGTYSTDTRYLRFMLSRLYQLYSDGSSSMKLEEHTRDLIDLLLAEYRQYVYVPVRKNKANIFRMSKMEHLYKNYDRMYRIVNYVSDHYSEKLSLEKIAKKEFLSTAHLSRYIKSTLGLTFSQLVSLTRCENASLLLSATSKTMDQIAGEVGFSNRSDLAAHFRTWYRKSPSEYRNSVMDDLRPGRRIEYGNFDFQFASRILDMYLDSY